MTEKPYWYCGTHLCKEATRRLFAWRTRKLCAFFGLFFHEWKIFFYPLKAFLNTLKSILHKHMSRKRPCTSWSSWQRPVMRPTFERVPRLSCSSYPMMRAWPKLSLLCPLRKQGPGFVILLELAFPSPEIEMMNVSTYIFITA